MKKVFRNMIENMCGATVVLMAFFILVLSIVGTFLFCTPGGWLILFIIAMRGCSG